MSAGSVVPVELTDRDRRGVETATVEWREHGVVVAQADVPRWVVDRWLASLKGAEDLTDAHYRAGVRVGVWLTTGVLGLVGAMAGALAVAVAALVVQAACALWWWWSRRSGTAL